MIKEIEHIQYKKLKCVKLCKQIFMLIGSNKIDNI